MSEYWASNGAVIRSSDAGIYIDGSISGTRLFPSDIAALREFFQHERDEELGRKPWHDAKPGEVWIITTSNVADERAVQVTPKGTFQYTDAIEFPQDFPLTYAAITSGRRIWPEDA